MFPNGPTQLRKVHLNQNQIALFFYNTTAREMGFLNNELFKHF